MDITQNDPQNALIIAFVGMPGAGKTEAVSYLQKKEIPFVRFGDLTDEGLRNENLEITPVNEQVYREKIRQELGMAAYAVKAEPKIRSLLQKNAVVALDGLYSWEEYKYLKERFPNLQLIHIFAGPNIRYQRLAKRPVRPFSNDEARKRDFAEIEKLNKGGSIAISDHVIDNSSDNIEDFYRKVDSVLLQMGIQK
jgi:dephospho-CoA kinase